MHMGKINQPDVEAIRLSDSNSENTKITKMSVPYMADPTLVPRVQKYLESNIDKTYVDINQMADELQKMYKEYARRKRSAFRSSVKKAYSIVLRSYGLEDRDSSDEDILSNDSDQQSDENDKYQEESATNNQLLDMYKRQAALKLKINEDELIDISSEDSEEEAAYGTLKTSNGATPSTSQNNKGVIIKPVNNKPSTHEKKADSEQSNQAKKRKIAATVSPLNDISIARPKKKKNKQEGDGGESTVTFKDVAGLDEAIDELLDLVVHNQQPDLYKIYVKGTIAVLLHGPPGSGKTLLAQALAGEFRIPIINVVVTEIIAGISGESEERIRDLFERAYSNAPCILFLDDLDALNLNTQNPLKPMEMRVISQLKSCLENLGRRENGHLVVVLGAIRKAESMDPALRTVARFSRDIYLGMPDERAREQIFRTLSAPLNLPEDFDYAKIARHTPGYVGGDLKCLCDTVIDISKKRLVNMALGQLRMERQRIMEKAVEEAKKVKEFAKKKAEEAEKKKKEKETADREAEIVVDDEVAKAVETLKETNEDHSNNAVVVLDDIDEVSLSKEPQEATLLTTEPTGGEVSSEAAQVEQAEPAVELDAEIIVEEESKSPEEPMPVDEVELVSTREDKLSWFFSGRTIPQDILNSFHITMDDFDKAMKKVQPYAKREGFLSIPDVSWEDVGSLKNIKEELHMVIFAPVKYPERYEQLGIHVPAGVLLCGPPGCGKTLLAKAVANELSLNFIAVNGPELLNKYVGESEKAVREVFQRARNLRPCVIFFDEFDALCPRRSTASENGATSRVVNQMLTEMDGMESRKGVFLLAATNRPDVIDRAAMRPGRLEKTLYVGLPSAEDRVDILKAITKNGLRPPLADDVDLVGIGMSEQTEGFTGADLAALVREASTENMREFLGSGGNNDSILVYKRHFDRAFENIVRSVSDKDRQYYEKLKQMYAVPDRRDVEAMEYS